MGAWGTALYSDDLAADLKADLRTLVGDGLSIEAAVAHLLSSYSSSLRDADDASVVWLVIADAAWRMGRPHPQATREALRVIEDGDDLRRWSTSTDRSKRQKVLTDLAVRLASPAPAAKPVPKTITARNAWAVGEVVTFRLLSGSLTAFRVIGHYTDKGGTHALCELLDWCDRNGATLADTALLRVRESTGALRVTQVMLGEPRKKADRERFQRTGLMSPPTQRPAGYAVFVFPYLDRQLAEVFGLE